MARVSKAMGGVGRSEWSFLKADVWVPLFAGFRLLVFSGVYLIFMGFRKIFCFLGLGPSIVLGCGPFLVFVSLGLCDYGDMSFVSLFLEGLSGWSLLLGVLSF